MSPDSTCPIRWWSHSPTGWSINLLRTQEVSTARRSAILFRSPSHVCFANGHSCFTIQTFFSRDSSLNMFQPHICHFLASVWPPEGLVIWPAFQSSVIRNGLVIGLYKLTARAWKNCLSLRVQRIILYCTVHPLKHETRVLTLEIFVHEPLWHAFFQQNNWLQFGEGWKCHGINPPQAKYI